MAGTTISSSITTGVTLTSTSQNPVTITGSGTINAAGSSADAIYAAFGTPGTIINAGLLQAPNAYGVLLRSAGSITNGGTANTHATITGGVAGIRLGAHGTGTVANFGTIASTGTAGGVGVQAFGNASVTNGSAGDTAALITGYFEGVELLGTSATVINFGTINATATSTTIGSTSIGVYLTNGGLVTNGSAADTAASIIGVDFSLEIAHGAGTVNNFGTIKSTGPLGRGILLEDGGSVVNNVGGYIGASSRNGVYIGGGAGTVTNLGAIRAGNNGVSIRLGGTVTNGSATDKTASIIGAQRGIYIGGLPSAVKNFGTIATPGAHPGINLYLGGNVVNGAATDTTALITGGTGIYTGGLSTIVNFATITGIGGSALSLRGGATIVNGSATDQTAVIAALGGGVHSAIYNNIGLTTITNFGTVSSTTSSAIHLNQGGAITNGSTADKKASILSAAGHTAIYAASGLVTVTNFGTILGGSDSIGDSTGIIVKGAAAKVVNAGLTDQVYFSQGGAVTNQATGTIVGGANTGGTVNNSAVYITGAAGFVTNDGLINGRGSVGVHLHAGGALTNQAGGTITSSTGSEAVLFRILPATLTNAGVIRNSGAHFGVYVGAGGLVTNQASASIAGGLVGVIAELAPAIVVNNGSITGTGTAGIGVALEAGGSITNATSASIKGASIGVDLPGGGTLKNAGTIIGTSGTAVVFGGTGSNRLVLDPGFGFSGKVLGSASASNTLELASATSTGAINGLGTSITGFGSTVVDASARWTVSGVDNVATLTNNGSLTVGGTLQVTAAVAPTSSGLFILGTGATLEVAADTGAGNKMQFLNSAKLIVDNAAQFGTHVGFTTYTGPLIESFAAGDSILLKNVLAAGSVLNYSAASGLLQVSGGGTATLLFQNSSLGAGGFHLGADGSGHAVITHS